MRKTSNFFHSPTSEPEYQILCQAANELFQKRSDLASTQEAAILDILQTNLASGRIARRFKGQLPTLADEFVTAYVASIIDYYLAENPSLLLLHAGYAEAWQNLASWLTRCAYVKLQQINALNGLDGCGVGDFAQETSLRLLEAFSRLDLPSQDGKHSPSAGLAIGYTYDVPFSDWIAKVQSNRIIDVARRSGRRSQMEIVGDVDELIITTEDIGEMVLKRMALGWGISQLTQYQQKVIEQLYILGVDVKEAAQRLGCTDRAVYNRKHAAVNRLRHKLAN